MKHDDGIFGRSEISVNKLIDDLPRRHVRRHTVELCTAAGTFQEHRKSGNIGV
jgi:hypothetical protein